MEMQKRTLQQYLIQYNSTAFDTSVFDYTPTSKQHIQQNINGTGKLRVRTFLKSLSSNHLDITQTSLPKDCTDSSPNSQIHLETANNNYMQPSKHKRSSIIIITK